MITRDRAHLEGGDVAEFARAVLDEHDRNRVEMDALRRYYAGEHVILERTKTKGASNNRLVVNHAKYIVDLASAYLIGSPIGYADDGQAVALEALLDAYRRCNTDSVDAELAKYAGIYGRGVELLYLDSAARPRTAAQDPRHAFVVYDDTVAHTPLLGVHRVPKATQRGEADGYLVTIYTDDFTYRYTQRDWGAGLTLREEPEQHFFGGVPVIEYWNNEDERGDFAPVTTLIDAYNLLMSDRVNDKEQLVDALLLLTGGSLGDTDKEFEQAVRRLRDQKVLEMPATGASAEYLTKQLNESQAQVLADALARDIHKIAMVPALTDEDFAGQSSGVAMRFKLLGLEQLTKTKERWFREGLRARMRLFSNALSVRGAPALDAETVQMTFNRGLPVNDLEQAQMVSMLLNIVPDELLLRQISFVDDAKQAMALLEKQRQEQAKKEAERFASYSDANMTSDRKDDGDA